jgi:hypothetical protein
MNTETLCQLKTLKWAKGNTGVTFSIKMQRIFSPSFAPLADTKFVLLTP